MANYQNWQDIMDNLAKDKTKLKVYRGKQNAINHLEPEDGAIYFAIDTKKIFLGTKVTNALGTSIERILMSSTDGGNGSFGFVYSAASLNDGTLIKVNPDVDNIADLLVREKIKIITTGAGTPGNYMEKWKEN